MDLTGKSIQQALAPTLITTTSTASAGGILWLSYIGFHAQPLRKVMVRNAVHGQLVVRAIIQCTSEFKSGYH